MILWLFTTIQHPLWAATGGLSKPFLLDFENTDVVKILRALMVQSNAQIIVSPEVKGTIPAIRLWVTSVGDALDKLTAAVGVTYREVNGTYLVAPSANMRALVARYGEKQIYTLNHLTADQATQLIEGAFPDMTVRPAGTDIFLIGTHDDIVQALALLAKQDAPVQVQPQNHEIVGLKFAKPSEVIGVLKDMVPQLKVEAVGNTLAMSGDDASLRTARQVIEAVDVEPKPSGPLKVYREYKIKFSSAEALRKALEKAVPDVSVVIGPESYSPPQPAFRPLSGQSIGILNSGMGATGGFGSSYGGGGGIYGGGTGGGMGGLTTGYGTTTTQQQVNSRSKDLFLAGPKQDVEAAMKLLAEMDTAPSQVMVDVKVIDTSPSVVQNIGLQWSWNNLTFVEQHSSVQPLPGGGSDLLRPSVGIGSFARIPFSAAATLNAIETNTHSKILADPRIQVLDNDDASIFIGQTVRVPVAVAVSGVGTVQNQLVEIPVGIILLVRPRVNGHDDITMHVHPVVSTISGFLNGYPQTASREAETTVRVHDGDTIVIGGLIQDEKTVTDQKIPILGDLPIIGYLFRNHSVNHSRDEVLVFITPHIIPPSPNPS